MTTPHIKISEEAIRKGAEALERTGILSGSMWITGSEADEIIEGAALAVAEAVAPLIAAQVLQPVADAYTEILRRETQNCGHGRSGHLDERDLKLLFDALYPKWSGPLSENSRERSPAEAAT